MRRFDNYTWRERENLDFIKELDFPDYILLEFLKSLLEIAEAEGI